MRDSSKPKTSRLQDRLQDRPAQQWFEEYYKYLKSQCTARSGYSFWYVKVFARWLSEEGLHPRELESFHFAKYVQALESGRLCKKTKHFRPRTLSRLRAEALKAMRTWTKWGLFLSNPWQSFSAAWGPKSYHHRALSRTQMEALLSILDLSCPLGLRNQAILELAYGSGLRVSEVADLALECVSLSEKCLHLKNTKNGWDRTVPLTEASFLSLKSYLEKGRPQLAGEHSGSKLWVNCRGCALTVSGIQDMIFSLHRHVDFYFSFHDLRHSCATHLVEGGASVIEVGKLLGHENLESTAYYTRVKFLELQKVHAKTHPRG